METTQNALVYHIYAFRPLFYVLAIHDYLLSWFNNIQSKHDVRGFAHHSIVHKENPDKMQQCIKILFHVFVKLNMFRATHRPSSGA